ncbi:class I SAM-dependent methyltransferase [Thermoproteota archaeon]
MKTQYDDIMKYKSQPGELLEIGCSYGMLMEYFIKNGWKATGIDISKNAIQNAKSKGLDCYNDTPEEFKPKGKFDVIILSNVLEHLQHPEQCLSIIKNWLKEDGIIYIRVPNVDSIILPSFRTTFLGDLKPFEHFFYFNKSNLGALLNQVELKSAIKTDGAVSLGNILNCYFRSKIVLSHSWQSLNVKKRPEEKKIYLLAKHIYGELLTVLTAISMGPKNRELVAFAGLEEKSLRAAENKGRG